MGSGLQVTPACSRGWSVPPQEFCDSSGAFPVAGAPSGWAGAPPWGTGHSPALPAATAPCSPTATSGKKQAAKSKEELAQEKKKELERRLQDVSGQLSNSKKPAKRGRAAPVQLGAGEWAAARCVSQRRLSAPRNPDLLTCGWGSEAEQAAGMWESTTLWSSWERALWPSRGPWGAGLRDVGGTGAPPCSFGGSWPQH